MEGERCAFSITRGIYSVKTRMPDALLDKPGSKGAQSAPVALIPAPAGMAGYTWSPAPGQEEAHF